MVKIHIESILNMHWSTKMKHFWWFTIKKIQEWSLQNMVQYIFDIYILILNTYIRLSWIRLCRIRLCSIRLSSIMLSNIRLRNIPSSNRLLVLFNVHTLNSCVKNLNPKSMNYQIGKWKLCFAFVVSSSSLFGFIVWHWNFLKSFSKFLSSYISEKRNWRTEFGTQIVHCYYCSIMCGHFL